MGKVMRAFALGAALSVATLGCGSDKEKSPLEIVEGLDLSNLPEPDVAIEKRREAEKIIGKTCVVAIDDYDELDLNDAVDAILTLSSEPCGDTWGEVNHKVVVMRAHNAEVEFSIDKANE